MRKLIVTGTILITCFILLVVIRLTMRNKSEPFSNTITLPCSVETTNPENNKLCQNLIDDKIARENMTGTFSSVTSSNWNKDHERVEVTDSRTNIRRNAWIPYGGEELTLHLENKLVDTECGKLQISFRLTYNDPESDTGDQLVDADVQNCLFDNVVKIRFETDNNNPLHSNICDYYEHKPCELRHYNQRQIDNYVKQAREGYTLNPFAKDLVENKLELNGLDIMQDPVKRFLYHHRAYGTKKEVFYDTYFTEDFNRLLTDSTHDYWTDGKGWVDSTWERIKNQFITNIYRRHVYLGYSLRDINKQTITHTKQDKDGLNHYTNHGRNNKSSSFTAGNNNFRTGYIELTSVDKTRLINDIEIVFYGAKNVHQLIIEHDGSQYMYDKDNLNYSSTVSRNFHDWDKTQGSNWFEPPQIKNYSGNYDYTPEQREKYKIFYTVPLLNSNVITTTTNTNEYYTTPATPLGDQGETIQWNVLQGKLYTSMDADQVLFKAIPHTRGPTKIEIKLESEHGTINIPNCYLKYNHTTIWRYSENDGNIVEKVIELDSGYVNGSRIFYPSKSATPSTWLYGLTNSELGYKFSGTDSNSYLYDQKITRQNTSNWFECRSNAIHDKRNAFTYHANGTCHTLNYDPSHELLNKFNYIRRGNNKMITGVNIFDPGAPKIQKFDFSKVTDHFNQSIYNKTSSDGTETNRLYTHVDGFHLLPESKLNHYLNNDENDDGSSFYTDDVGDINQCYGRWIIDYSLDNRMIGNSGNEYVGCSVQRCGYSSPFVGTFSNLNNYCEPIINSYHECVTPCDLLVSLFPKYDTTTSVESVSKIHIVSDSSEGCEWLVRFNQLEWYLDTRTEIDNTLEFNPETANNKLDAIIQPDDVSCQVSNPNKIEIILDSTYGTYIDMTSITLTDDEDGRISDYMIYVETKRFKHRDTNSLYRETDSQKNPLFTDLAKTRVIWQNNNVNSAKKGDTLVTITGLNDYKHVRSLTIKTHGRRGPIAWKIRYDKDYSIVGNKNSITTVVFGHSIDLFAHTIPSDQSTIGLKTIRLKDASGSSIEYDIVIHPNLYMDPSTDWESMNNKLYNTNTLHNENDTYIRWKTVKPDNIETNNDSDDPFDTLFRSQFDNIGVDHKDANVLPEDVHGLCTEIDCYNDIPECYYHDHSNASTPETSWSNCEFIFNETENIYNDKWSIWKECTALSEDQDCRHDRERTKGSLCNIYCPEHTLVGAHWSCGSNLQLNDPCRSNPTDECGSNVFGHTLQCSTNTGSVVFEKSEFSNATCQYNIRNCAIDTTKGYSNFCSYGKTYIQLSEPKLFGGECSNEGWSYQNPIYSSDADFLDENSNLTLFGYSNIQTNLIEDSSENTYDLRISGNDADPDSDRSKVHFPYGHFQSNCRGSNHDLCVFNSHCREDLVCDFIENRCKKP